MSIFKKYAFLDFFIFFRLSVSVSSLFVCQYLCVCASVSQFLFLCVSVSLCEREESASHPLPLPEGVPQVKVILDVENEEFLDLDTFLGP